MQKMIYYIQDINCTGCVSKIKKNLATIHGISNIKINIKEDSISFVYDRIQILDQVRYILEKLGHPLLDSQSTMTHITKSYINCIKGKARSKDPFT